MPNEASEHRLWWIAKANPPYILSVLRPYNSSALRVTIHPPYGFSERLEPSDTLIVTELSRLGRSTAEVIALVNALIGKPIRIIILKQNLDIRQHDMNSKVIITLFSLFGELERDLVSSRTKEALSAKKAQGQTLGKPRGTIQKSKFDAHQERIKELLGLGLSVRKIAKVLGYSSHIALNAYINKCQVKAATKVL